MADLAEMRESWTPRVLSVFRIVVALLYLQHPLAKFLGFPHVAAFDNLQPLSLVWVAGVIEIICTPLLLVGLFTRLVAFILSGERAVAYFMLRPPRGFFPLLNGGEAEALLALACGASTTSGDIHLASG